VGQRRARSAVSQLLDAAGLPAYLKYAQRIGDRFPMQRNVFTRMVLRISETLMVPGVLRRCARR
jgi:hypothetical protein